MIAAPPPPSDPTGPIVLVVEDEPSILRLARTVLDRAGYRVRTAGDVAEAVAIADAQGDELDLLVTDDRLPSGRGGELADRLRERWPYLPVLLTSGHPEPAGGIPAATAFLGKPYAPADLLAAVRGCLEARGGA